MEMPVYVKNCIELLENAGYEAYAVGGCVRDTLMGKVPSDWDVTTSALPEEMQTVFKDFRLVETGIKHGTVTVLCEKNCVEITTFRIDGTYSDSRHPDNVIFSRALSDDLSRRDFTVNAMAYSEKTGVIDLFGGKKDLKCGVLRTVGQAKRRFSEDALRILRAVRFASTLDFEIEEKTLSAMYSCMHRLNEISAERIKTELFKMLCGNGCERVLTQYRDVVASVIKPVKATFDLAHRSPYHCYDVWTHTVKSICAAPKEPLIRFALLLHDLGKPDAMTEDENGRRHFKGHVEKSAAIAKDICEKLKMSAYEKTTLIQLVRLHDSSPPASRAEIKRWVRDYGADFLRLLLQVKKADIWAHSEKGRAREKERAKAELILEQIIAENACCTISQLAVSGTDLKALGVAEGKQIGAMLTLLLENVIEEKVENDKEKLIEFLKSHLNKLK